MRSGESDNVFGRFYNKHGNLKDNTLIMFKYNYLEIDFKQFEIILK